MVLEVTRGPNRFVSRDLRTPDALAFDVGEYACEREQGLKEGQIILAGGATAAVPLAPGQRVRVRVQSLGEASFFTK